MKTMNERDENEMHDLFLFLFFKEFRLNKWVLVQ